MDLAPTNFAALFEVGRDLTRDGRLEDAVFLLRAALVLQPNSVDVLSTLGSGLRRLERLDDAQVLLLRAVTADPAAWRAHYELGLTLVALEKRADAVTAFERAIALHPEEQRPRVALANALIPLGKTLDAIALLDQALTAEPDLAVAYELLRRAKGDLADIPGSIRAAREALRLGGSAGEHSNLVFSLHYVEDTTPAAAYSEARRWAVRHARPPQARSATPARLDAAKRRLRVGYVSADIREHPVGRLIEPVLRLHNRERFEIFLYSDQEKSDAVSGHLESLSEHVRRTGTATNDQFVELVRLDHLDVLVELSGHFGRNRLVALSNRLAPVQVSGFGYCGTTGVSQIDYRLTDECSDPAGVSDQFHTEKLVRLPDCCWCYRPFGLLPDVAALPAGINGYVTFGSLNNAIKLSAKCIGIWSELLHKLPTARLLLLGRRDTEIALRQRFAERGVADNRIQFVKPMRRNGYFETYGKIDIALDPMPFNGDNTTCDALWMGVPVISLVGEAFAARRGFSHLSALGLSQWTSATAEGFMSIAIEMARNLDDLGKVRQGLRLRFAESPLHDAERYVHNLEEFLSRIAGPE